MYTSTANGILAVSIAFPLLAALFVALRFAARRLKAISPQADDWTTVISLVFCFGQGINSIIGVVSGALGTPRDELTKTKAISLLKIVYADSFLCFTSEAIVKIAILLFYKRIFITKSFTITANAMMIAVIFWHVASILVLLCSQNPISGHWNLVSNVGVILNFNAFLIANSSIDLGLDIVILCLPLPVISKLHIVPRRKVALVGIFWLGFFCSIAEAVRIYYFHRLLFSSEIAHSDAFGPTVANVLIWSRIEPCCSVIAACLPTIGPIFKNGRSPESLINSIRSYLSSHSTFNLTGDKSRKTSHENHTKESYELDDRKRWNQLHSSGDTTIERDEIGVLEASRSEPGANEIVVKQSFASEYGP